MWSQIMQLFTPPPDAPSVYREAGRVDGKRGIPDITMDEQPERLRELEKSGNQRLAALAEEHTKRSTTLRSKRLIANEAYMAAERDWQHAIDERTAVALKLKQAEDAYAAIHRKAPVHRGLWPYALMVLFIVLTAVAEYPLNHAAISQLGENEYLTRAMAVAFTIILMVVAHVIGGLFRNDSPVAHRTARFLVLVVLVVVFATSVLRRTAVGEGQATADAALLFIVYFSIQILIVSVSALAGYCLHEPMQLDFEAKARSVARSHALLKKAEAVVLLRRQNVQAEWTEECAEDYVYIDRDEKLRNRIEELRATYLRANQAARTDLAQGTIAYAYKAPLNLIRPPALIEAWERVNSRRKTAA